MRESNNTLSVQTCCCTLRECSKQHRHCKAYRYRRKRAAQAETLTDQPQPERPAGAARLVLGCLAGLACLACPAVACLV
jgi:hypothetical protein